jgi:hypothetical protein
MSIHINNVTAFVYEDAVNRDKAPSISFNQFPTAAIEDGYLNIDVTLSGQPRSTHYQFPLVSIWPNRTKSDIQNITKAIALVPQKPKGGFTKEQEELERHYEFCRDIWREGNLSRRGDPDMNLSVDRYFKIIRWGGELVPFRAQSDNWNIIPIYDTQAKALTAVLETIKGRSSQKLAGMDLVNLAKLSDSILAEIGFARIDDLLKRSPPMWQGDPEKILTAGESSWAFRQSFGQRASEEIVESFIKLLERELNPKQQTETAGAA